LAEKFVEFLYIKKVDNEKSFLVLFPFIVLACLHLSQECKTFSVKEEGELKNVELEPEQKQFL
jgi:hypothetical protein